MELGEYGSSYGVDGVVVVVLDQAVVVGRWALSSGVINNKINKITWQPQTQPNGLCMATGYINPHCSTTNFLRNPHIPHKYIIIMTIGSVQDQL